MTQTTQEPSAALSGRPFAAVAIHPRRGDPQSAMGWQQRYVRRLAIGDAAVLSIAIAVAVVVQSARDRGRLAALAYAGLAALLALSWMLALAAGRAYEPRFLGCGSEEYKRVANASMHLIAAIALIAFALRLAPARSFVGLAVVLGTGTLLLHRYAARRVLYRDRLNGLSCHRVLAVGDQVTLTNLLAAVDREPKAGFNIVAVCAPQSSEGILAQVDALGVDVIAVTASAGLAPEFLRRLAWELEGRGVDLIVAPALTDVAGPRIAIRPVAGLPLLHVDQPDITGGRYLFKEIVERALALTILVATLPVLCAIAVAIKVTSPGPVLFRQERARRHGESFQMLKFRSMHVGAEDIVQQLRDLNDFTDGPLFKIREDPRVTWVGRLLRRWSLDELPQLVNVLRGDMALVGPRPPLPHEVATYTDGVHRRLLVKPGMTGLWQVSGRSDLSWGESVRLDLYYVENWSLSLDLQILWRTFSAVVSSAGAY
jgi:exopolysaccharide biosynthesis polyprenyl glycosylphosphotransferase